MKSPIKLLLPETTLLFAYFFSHGNRRIGIEANEELRSIFKKEVHLMLQVRVARKRNA